MIQNYLHKLNGNISPYVTFKSPTQQISPNFYDSNVVFKLNESISSSVTFKSLTQQKKHSNQQLQRPNSPQTTQNKMRNHKIIPQRKTVHLSQFSYDNIFRDATTNQRDPPPSRTTEAFITNERKHVKVSSDAKFANRP